MATFLIYKASWGAEIIKGQWLFWSECQWCGAIRGLGLLGA